MIKECEFKLWIELIFVKEFIEFRIVLIDVLLNVIIFLFLVLDE